MERIGKIVNTHGIKGELKIQSNSDFIETRFSVGKIVAVEYENKFLEFEIQTFRMHKGSALITLKNNLDINLVEKYKNSIIYQELDEINLEEDEYMYSDLIGLKVVTEEGLEVGVLDNVLEYPAQDILVVKTSTKEVLIPFVKEIAYEVGSVIRIKNLEGLL